MKLYMETKTTIKVTIDGGFDRELTPEERIKLEDMIHGGATCHIQTRNAKERDGETINTYTGFKVSTTVYSKEGKKSFHRYVQNVFNQFEIELGVNNEET